jgi:hypothetical protein
VSGNQCHCGKPIQDTGSLCPACGEILRRNLHKIADRWPELEKALTTPTAGGEKGKTKNSMVSVGTDLNERAVAARRACTDAVWFAWRQVIRDDLDTAGKPYAHPPVAETRSQDETPVLARWLATWHVAHVTHKTSRESAEDIANQVERAERLTFEVCETTPERKIPTGLPCEQHATTTDGERVPCPGVMRAPLVGDYYPDLVCSKDTSHRIPPDVWARTGWKRAHTMDESAARRLAERITG